MSSFTVRKNGSLKAAPGSPLSLPVDGMYSVQVGPRGKFAYVADDDTDLFGLRINQTSGAIHTAQGSPFNNGLTMGEDGVAFLGKHALLSFALSSGADVADIFVHQRGTGGTLLPTGAQMSGFSDLDAHAVDSSGKHLLVVSSNSLAVDLRSFLVAPGGFMLLGDQRQEPFGRVDDVEFLKL